MNTRLNCIMLIDDNESTNFIHSRTIRKNSFSKDVITFNRGKKALKYLAETKLQNSVIPNLIFLDINMPGMNGWEFLVEYEKLDEGLKDSIMMMLSTSINEDDYLRSKQNTLLSGFFNKPLSKIGLEEIINTHF